MVEQQYCLDPTIIDGYFVTLTWRLHNIIAWMTGGDIFNERRITKRGWNKEDGLIGPEERDRYKRLSLAWRSIYASWFWTSFFLFICNKIQKKEC